MTASETTNVSMAPVSEDIDFVKLELRTAYGPVYRDVSTRPPRPARLDEIPVIDLGDMNGTPQERKQIVQEIRRASHNTGFFYIKNHGIDESTIDDAYDAAKMFFKQPYEEKMKVSKKLSKHFNGYHAMGTSKASRAEGVDRRESFMWSYDPKYDPEDRDPSSIPEEVKPWLRGEEFVWEGTKDLPAFKDISLRYWQECLMLARQLLKLFALTLDLEESYFDPVTTYPGFDGVFNFYPAHETEQEAQASSMVGIGSHTDLQVVTLLPCLKDMVPGLEVLSREGQWLQAPPIKGTFVVNIGDFLMRITNDTYQSTVHRAFNRSTQDRLSMPCFFGFNFDKKIGVLPCCTDPQNPPRYEPMSCGDWCLLRFRQTEVDVKRAETAEDAEANRNTESY